MSEKCLKSVRKVSEKCLKSVRKVFEKDLWQKTAKRRIYGKNPPNEGFKTKKTPNEGFKAKRRQTKDLRKKTSKRRIEGKKPPNEGLRQKVVIKSKNGSVTKTEKGTANFEKCTKSLLKNFCSKNVLKTV